MKSRITSAAAAADKTAHARMVDAIESQGIGEEEALEKTMEFVKGGTEIYRKAQHIHSYNN